jgi:hypothetical protein
MEAESIMSTVRSGKAPSDWNVWPLRRDRVLVGAAKWGLLSLVGFVLFVPIVMATVPSDFVNTGAIQQSIVTAIIILVGALAVCSLYLAIEALLRARRASEHWLVITPDLFIKAGPRRLFEIPLEDIADITLKGVAPPTDTAVQGAIGPQYFAMGQFSRIANQMGVMGGARTRTRGAASLAFRDRRDNHVVTIGTDDSFDHLGAIESILRERAAQKEEKSWRASLKSSRAK